MTESRKKFLDLLSLTNLDLRQDLLINLEQFVNQMTDGLNNTVVELFESDKDNLRTYLDNGLKIFASIKDSVDNFETKTELGKLFKQYYLSQVSCFSICMAGVKNELSGGPNTRPKNINHVLKLVFDTFITMLEMIDGWIENGQKELAIQNMKEDLNLKRVILRDLAQFQVESDLGKFIIDLVAIFVKRTITYVAINVLLFEEVA